MVTSSALMTAMARWSQIRALGSYNTGAGTKVQRDTTRTRMTMEHDKRGVGTLLTA